MPGLANYQTPAPKKWEDFEDLCLALWRRIWNDQSAQKNGRQGQPQRGVDIFGRPDGGSAWAGLQCKGKNGSLGSVLTQKELLAEVERAKGFVPALSAWTIVSTAPRDANLQERARLLTDEHASQGLFSVHVWSWEDVLLQLDDLPDVAAAHFPHFHPIQQVRVAPQPRAADASEEPRIPVIDPAPLTEFRNPHVGPRMLPRAARTSLVGLLAGGTSVYLQAPSGFGKSVLLSQLTLPCSAWINADEHREFAQFRQRLAVFVQARYRRGGLPEAPRDLARTLDQLVGASSDPLVLMIDDADRIDNGIKTFLEECITSARHVCVAVTASTLRFKRQQALQASARLRVLTAAELAFDEDETTAIITAPIAGSDRLPTASLAHIVATVTHGWPIAVQLVRARLEREPDEEAIVRSLEEIGKDELSEYLMESFWATLDPQLKVLLLSTSIFQLFDRGDAQAVMPDRLDTAWEELVGLPFVTQLPQAPVLLLYQPLFKAFLGDRLSRERTPKEVRQLHRAAAVHFLDQKEMPPGAHHHARLAGDADLLTRATGRMADFVSYTGAYVHLKQVLDSVSPAVRWGDATLAVQQGRLYEHDRDLENALKWYRRAQTLFDEKGPDYWRRGIVNDIGGILRRTGKMDEAIALYDAALAQFPTDEPSMERAGFLTNRANVFLHRGALADAEAGFLEAKRIFDLHQSATGLTRTHAAFAQIARARKQNDESFQQYVTAFRWARKAGNAELLLSVALPLGELLIFRKQYQFAHGLFKDALTSAVESGAEEQVPYLLTNFGCMCVALPEPDSEGVRALAAASEMKRTARINRNNTIFNLTSLLMRLGRFDDARPVLREQARLAEETKDRELADDARAKLAELAPASHHAGAATAGRMRGHVEAARSMAIEGRLRERLRERWPMVREIVAVDEPNQEDLQIDLGAKTVALRDAKTILFLLPESIALPATVPSGSDDQNFIFEAIWPKGSATKRTSSSALQFSAIWWVRVGNQLWIQPFWNEPPASADESARLVVLKGVFFVLDAETQTWRHTEHPEGCNCGRADAHESLRELASALMTAFSDAASKERVIIAKHPYPIVSLLSHAQN